MGKKLKQLKEVVVKADDKSKVFKIRYTCNILPNVDEEGAFGTIINTLTETDELPQLLEESVQSLIEYKWAKFARKS